MHIFTTSTHTIPSNSINNNLLNGDKYKCHKVVIILCIPLGAESVYVLTQISTLILFRLKVSKFNVKIIIVLWVIAIIIIILFWRLFLDISVLEIKTYYRANIVLLLFRTGY